MVFCHTSTKISHRYTHVPSLLDLLPISLPQPTLQLVAEPLFELPESYSKFPLAVCFIHGIVYICVTLSVHLPFSLLCSHHVHRYIYTHGIVYICVTLSIHLPFSFLCSHHVHRSVLYVCFSIAALKRNSTAPSLQIPYISVST